MTSFYLNYLFKDLVCKYSHLLRYWGLGCQHMNSGGGGKGRTIQTMSGVREGMHVPCGRRDPFSLTGL